MAAAGVGMVYDPRMRAHKDPYNKHHPEQPSRISAIWKSLEDSGVLDRCVRVPVREATKEELSTVHTEKHVETMCSVSDRSYGKEGRAVLARRYNSIYFNDGSSRSALLAAGSVVELSLRVARGELSSGAAVVRPPGHHAEADEAMGFCLFNNVAVAAQVLLNSKAVDKILIVDWDVHHGNGTQHMFWQDPSVLYFSVHRYDNGYFYPIGKEGNYDKVGGGAGAGYNINVPWPRGGYGDADYIAVWEHVLMPVAREFNPDIVLISGGFDSARGDPLGGCNLSPLGYSIMTQQLMELAGGKVVLALEGGYNLKSIADSYTACVQTLLGDFDTKLSVTDLLYKSAVDIIEKVRQELSGYWPVLCEKLDKPAEFSLLKDVILTESNEEDEDDVFTGDSSIVEVEEVMGIVKDNDEEKELIQRFEVMNVKAIEDGTLTNEGEAIVVKKAVEILNLSAHTAENTSENMVYVWYATYGSNMWLPRLMAYIQGGKVEGAQIARPGLANKAPPVEDFWMSIPHRLFFGRTYSNTWGAGGVAFLDPVPSSDSSDFTDLRAYKITLEQFNGILAQENNLQPDTRCGLGSLNDMDTFGKPPSPLEFIKNVWYGIVLYLGDKDGLPIFTITCSMADVKRYANGDLPVCPPSAAYENTIRNGLYNKGFSEEDANEYIALRYTKQL